jgi:hypothetical protein
MPTSFLLHANANISLAERHAQLQRTAQTMWHLLKSRLDLNDAELQLALTTGAHNAVRRSSAQPAQSQLLDCNVCRHPIQSTAKCCLYCGTAPEKHFPSVSPPAARRIQQ